MDTLLFPSIISFFLHLFIILSIICIYLCIISKISLQEKSHSTIRDILSEIQTFLKIRHRNIVRLHGVEIHKVLLSISLLFILAHACNLQALSRPLSITLPSRLI